MAGSSLSLLVLPVLVYDLSGSASLTGLLFATRLVPYLLFGLIAGPVADRWNRRTLIIGGNVIEGVLAATIPVAAAFDVLTVGQIFVVTFLMATAFVFSDAAVFGAVPALVGKDHLAAANGALTTLASAADIVGPVAAGLLIATVGAATAVLIDAGSFLVAAAVQLTIRSDFRRSGPSAGQRSIRAQLRTAGAFIRRQRTILTLTAAGFGNSLAIGIVFGLLVPWSIEILGYRTDDARLGVLYAAIGVGSLVAGLTFARAFAIHRIRLLTPLTLACSAAASVVLLIPSGWLAPALVAVLFASVMLTITIGITYRQLATPDDLTSTVNTIGRMIAAGGQPLGATIGAGVAAITTVRTAYTTASVLFAVTAVLALVGLRSVEPELADVESA